MFPNLFKFPNEKNIRIQIFQKIFHVKYWYNTKKNKVWYVLLYFGEFFVFIVQKGGKLEN